MDKDQDSTGKGSGGKGGDDGDKGKDKEGGRWDNWSEKGADPKGKEKR